MSGHVDVGQHELRRRAFAAGRALSRPCCASPTIDSGSAPVQSSSEFAQPAARRRFVVDDQHAQRAPQPPVASVSGTPESRAAARRARAMRVVALIARRGAVPRRELGAAAPAASVR